MLIQYNRFHPHSMHVTRDYVKGQWRYRVETSPKCTVTYNTGRGSSNSTRYIEHHIDTLQMYDSFALSISPSFSV